MSLKKILLALFFVVALQAPLPNTYLLYPVYAADSTTSAKPASPSASIQQKLKELQAEIASKAAKLKTEINQKLQNRAYVGIVKSKGADSLTLITLSGNKTIKLNEYTTYTPNKGIKGFEVEAFVAALGDVDDTGVLIAKKIIVLKAGASFQPVITSGVIISADKNLVNLKLNDGTNTSFLVDGKTIFNSQLTLAEVLKPGKNLAAILVNNTAPKQASDSPKLRARFIYLSGTATPKVKLATASAKLSTNSATKEKLK